jgi:hypothetical protein
VPREPARAGTSSCALWLRDGLGERVKGSVLQGGPRRGIASGHGLLVSRVFADRAGVARRDLPGRVGIVALIASLSGSLERSHAAEVRWRMPDPGRMRRSSLERIPARGRIAGSTGAFRQGEHRFGSARNPAALAPQVQR